MIALTISNLAFGQNVTLLKKNQPAPYDGYLFTPAETLQLKNTTTERDSYKLLNTSLQTSLDTETKIADLNNTKANDLMTDNEKLSVDLKAARDTSELTKVLWFTLGIVATGAAMYGASKIVR